MASQSNNETAKTNPYTEGQYVDVQSRTWPGINKPGGIGRVSGVAGDRVSVRYLVGRRHEKEIPIKYVKPYDIPSERLRDRALLKGRCSHCGSLRNDCGSCDLSFGQVTFLEDEKMPSRQSVTRTTRRLKNGISDLVFTDQPEQMVFDLDSQSSSSGSDDEIEKEKHRYRRYQKLKREAEKILGNRKKDSDAFEALEEDDDDEEEEESDIDNIPLRQLVRYELLSQLSPVRANRGRYNDKSRPPQRGNRRYVINDSSDSEIELAALSDASSSRSVSLPGTQDLSVDRTQLDEFDPLVNNDIDGSSDESRVSDATGYDDEQVLVASLGGFIQPEGDATRMPQDTVDLTTTLQFAELGPFFDDLADSLEKQTIPWAEEKVEELVQQFETGRSATESNFVLLEKCSALENKLLIDLVRNGSDQCQKALGKLGVKPNIQNDIRGFSYNRIQDAVEKVLGKLRALLEELENAIESDNDEEMDSDDGWAEPAESPSKLPNHDTADSLLPSQSSTSSIDLHPHASKKRRARRSLKSKHEPSRKKSEKDRSRDQSMKKGQRLISESAEVRNCRQVNRDDPVLVRSNVLKSSRNKTSRRYTSRAAGGPGRQKRSETAVERMERFLLNNADGKENNVEGEHEEEGFLKAPRSSSKRQSVVQGNSRLADEAASIPREGRRQKQRVGRNRKSDEHGSMPQMQNASLSNYLLQCLRNRRSRREVNHDMDNAELTAESSRTLVDVCDELEKVFPHSVSCSLFKELLCVVCSPDGQTDSSTVFQLAVSLMKDSGSLTLQELVSQESSQLESYVALYVFVLKLLKNGLHCSLSDHHGISYKLFGAANSAFIEFLFLQFIDAVYALAHPDAWVLKVSNRRHVFETLSPLRDALGEHLALIEHASCFIDIRLGAQKWRLVPSRRSLFVSSVDPDSWKQYIEKAIEPEGITQSRFRSIGSVPCIPRVEVETLWRIFVFLSASTPPSVKLKKGWTFIPEMFQNGVFRMSEKTGSPSVRHLDAVEADIHFFSSIISSGAMGPLPRKDTVVVDIIRKTLLLHADALWHSEQFREAQLPNIDDAKSVLKRELSLSESWSDLHLFEVSSFVPMAFTELLNGLIRMTEPTESSTSSVGPSSRLLHSTLVLQFEWMTRAQRDCGQSFRVLIKYFQEESKKLFGGGNDNQSNRDAFQDAFPDSSILACKGGLPDSRKSLFLQECAAYLSIVAHIAPLAAKSVNQDESSLLEIVKKTWVILGNDELGNPGERFEMSPSISFDHLRPYVMGNALNFLLSWALGIIPGSDHVTATQRVPDRLVDEETLHYIVSALTRCLEVSSQSGFSEVIYSLARMTEKIVARIHQANLAETIDRRCFASLIEVLLGGCVRASINAINFLSRATFCGAEEDICLLSVLSLVRTTLAFRRTTSEEPESQLVAHSHLHVEEAAKSNDPADDEVWGDLNDDELLCMLDSVEGTNSEDYSTSGIFQNLQQLRCALSENLRFAIPSLRYEISHSDEQDLRMSSHGKLLVSRRVKAISMTLVSVLVSEQNLPVSSLADLVGLQASGNMDDEEYRRKVLLNCCRSLCNLTSSPRTRSLINHSSPGLVSVLVDSLLDINGLQNVPSCNFDHLLDDGCDARRRKAFDELLKFSRRSSSSRKVADIWNFCRELGNALSTSNGGSVSLSTLLGESFSNPEYDQAAVDLPCSLEKEYVYRFRCIRGIIAAHRQFDIPGSRTCSELCAEIIARSFEGLLRILKLLRIEEVASNGSPEPSYTKFRLGELFRCHSEFSTSILAWICREGSHIPSADFKEIWTRICTEFIVPMISSDPTGIYTCIERTYASVSEFLGTPPLSFPKVIELDANGECHRILSSIIINLSKEILLPMFVLENRTLQIFDKVLSAAARDSKAFSKCICRIFFKDTLLASSSLTERSESKLFQHLCQYWDNLLPKHPLDSKLERDLVDLKQHAMETLVALAKRSQGESRQGALYIINSILRRERNEDSPEVLNLEFTCSLIRTLPQLLKESLLEQTVDEEVVALIYKCLHNLSRQRSNKDAEANLAEWCAAKCLQPEQEDPKTILSSKYVTTALEWFETVGKIVLDQGEDCNNERMRLQLREVGRDGCISWESVTCSATLAHLSHEMKEIEKDLYPSLNPDRVVHNVYAAAKRTLTAEVTIEKWVPSHRVRKLIQTFSNK